ncbi:MAG: histidine phosphatase family protein [Actinomycetota bacterium]|nr:histidine phosphatase family protein [Actinomycetota bacterium]
MSVLLVRHAHAGDRDAWIGPDHLRPLSMKGIQQAEALVFALAGFEVGRVLSSTYLRCTQTVEPLALVRGVALETEAALAEGNGASAAELVRSLAGSPVVLCTHGDVIGGILSTTPAPEPWSMKKGSVWILEADATTGRFVEARYLPPPGRLA